MGDTLSAEYNKNEDNSPTALMMVQDEKNRRGYVCAVGEAEYISASLALNALHHDDFRKIFLNAVSMFFASAKEHAKSVSVAKKDNDKNLN